MDSEKIERFREMIKNSSYAVFFGGAGVSTESGVKDYRSEDGLYNTVKEYGVSPEEILSHSFFVSKPETFYEFYYKYFLSETAEPNNAHISLSKWEKEGGLKAVITQNIDGLHQKAGSKKVLELHGTVFEHYCMNCGAPFPTEEITLLKGKVPYCKSCNGLIRPKVTLYEEMLDEQVISEAIYHISKADLLVIGGTSLAVYPAAGFINYFKGENVVLINRDETGFDGKASLIFRDKIGDVLGEIFL